MNSVQLKTRRIFPIPNYGPAMTPFYAMLALLPFKVVMIKRKHVLRLKVIVPYLKEI